MLATKSKCPRARRPLGEYWYFSRFRSLLMQQQVLLLCRWWQKPREWTYVVAGLQLHREGPRCVRHRRPLLQSSMNLGTGSIRNRLSVCHPTSHSYSTPPCSTTWSRLKAACYAGVKWPLSGEPRAKRVVGVADEERSSVIQLHKRFAVVHGKATEFRSNKIPPIANIIQSGH
jgi:hypothetical protein